MELGVAVLVFTLIAGVVTLAVAGATVTGANTRLENALSGRLRSLVAVVASGSYDSVVTGTFERPDPCDAAPHLSCASVMGREFEVSWSVVADGDDLGVSSEDPVGVRVSASSTLPDGSPVSVSRYVSPDNLGSVGKGLLRVRVEGETLPSPLYLLAADGSILSASTVNDGRASIRTNASACSTAAPCRLALTPDGGLLTGGVGISAESVASGVSSIVLSDVATSEVTLLLEPERSLTVSLLAINPDGRMEWAGDPGSVCLYLEVPVAGGLIREPACNDLDPDRVVWRSITSASGPVPVPGSTALEVRSDPTEGFCAAPGQVGWSAGWEQAAVCTGWTWGAFTELRPGVTGLGSDVGSSIVLGSAADDVYYTAVWTSSSPTSLALPATGWNGDPLWENPRDVPSCASSSSCVPPTVSPEAACPGEHCNHTGGNAPVVVSPRSGSYKVASVEVPSGPPTEFDLVFDDNDGGELLTVTVVESPVWLSLGTEPLSTGFVLYDGAAGSGSVTVTADPPTSEPGTLVLDLADGSYQRTVTVIVGSDLGGVPAFLLSGPVRVAQGQAATTRVLLVDALGEGASALTASVSLPAGVAISDPVPGGDGWFSYSFTAPTAPAVSSSFTISTGSLAVESPFTVLPSTGTVAVSAGSLAQGGSSTATFTVLDLAGDPYAGAHVWGGLSTAAGAWPLGARLDPRGCITVVDGTCSVTLTASVTASTGAFTVTAFSGSASSSSSEVLEPSIASIVSEELSVEQGDSGTLTFTVLDGRNEPVAAALVGLSTVTAGVTIPSSVLTDASGSAAFSVDVASSALPGPVAVTVTGGAGVLSAGFEVRSTVSTVTVPTTPVRLAQRGATTVTVVAKNPQGVPVSGRVLDVVAPSGLFAPTSVYTLADGSAVFNVVAAEDRAIGSASLSVSYGGVALGTVAVNVVAGIAALEVYGELVAGSAAPVSFIAKNDAGMALTGRSLVLESKDSRVSVPSSPVTTNAAGVATFTLTSGSIPPGLYRFTVRVDGREIPVEVSRS